MSLSALEQRAVLPFYLKMMGLSAIDSANELWPDLVSVGRSLDAEDVALLLRQPGLWRPAVMGAWFSLGFTASEVGDPLRRAMRESGGSLTAPPVAIACALVVGRDAVPDMASYVERDPGDQSPLFVVAVIEALGGDAGVRPRDDDRSAFHSLHQLGTRLRADLTAT